MCFCLAEITVTPSAINPPMHAAPLLSVGRSELVAICLKNGNSTTQHLLSVQEGECKEFEGGGVISIRPLFVCKVLVAASSRGHFKTLGQSFEDSS